jgi:hypothetical protein
MNPFMKAIYLLVLNELGQITSDELRTQLRELAPEMKAALEGAESGTYSTPQTPGY